MSIEIEKKFLVDIDSFRKTKHTVANVSCIVQAYLTNPEVSDNCVRIRKKDNKAFITIKGKNSGISRLEMEYEIPLSDFKEMFASLKLYGVVSKSRLDIIFNGKKWEVDIFEGENQGLYLAEVELSSEKEIIDLPQWITREVSHEAKYYNENLARFPFSKWKS